MKNNIVIEKDKLAEGPIVMADECGDNLWDAVLAQEAGAYETAKAIHEQSVENDKR